MSGRKTLWLLAVILVLSARPALSWKLFSADAPDTGLLSNSFVDILYHNGTIWAAGGRGLSYSTDQGQSWYTRTTETNPGLSSNEPSALFGRTGEIWMAGSHFEMFEGINYPFGDGLSVSSDGGNTWTAFRPPDASNFGKLVYDISGTDDRIYAACFHGGFIVRYDPDTAWKHVFFSPGDSADFAADGWADLTTGRYYSCVVDTTHADTFVVYGGSARGVNKFLYIPKRVKLGGRSIYDIASAGDRIYLAHERGISQVDTSLQQYYTADQSNGLGGSWVRKLAVHGGRLWAGLFDPGDSSGLGLYYMDNPDSAWTAIGESVIGPPDLWSKVVVSAFEGPSAGVFDINEYLDSISSAFYIAAGDSGVYRSEDSGATWVRFFVDPLDTDPASPKNQVYSIDITGDSLFLGTRAGLVTAVYSQPFTIVNWSLMTFPEDDSTGSLVSLVRHQDSDSASFTWVGLAPQSDTGNYAAVFIDPDTLGNPRVTRILWSVGGIALNDIDVTENLSVLATTSGLFASLNLPTPASIAAYTVIDINTGLTLQSFKFQTAGYIGGRLFTGTTGGFGYRVGASDWRIFTANTDPDKHDLAVASTRAYSGLPGDWVVALDVLPFDTSAVLWASCRRVPDTLEQKNAVAFSTDYGASWTEALPNIQAWNFAFDTGGTAYVAASEGLFIAKPPWTDWQRAAIIDPITQDTMVSGTEIFSVEVADDVVWVGTELGLASKSIDPGADWEITRIFKPTSSTDEVFAAPVPYSPINFNGRLSLHYHVERSADITVEIYDFAMNLVTVVADSRPRAGGADYYETWDGYNDRGDMVATGIYYFRVSYSTGEERWGRLAIIP